MITKRGNNTWLITIYLGRDAATGKRDFYYETFKAPKKSMVEERERELTKRLKTPNTGPSSKISTVGELLGFWLEDLKDLGQAQERTIETYAGHIRKLMPVVGGLRLYNLDAYSVQEALRGKYTDLSSRTRKNLYSTLRTALRCGYGWGLMPNDVTAGIRTPKVETPEKPTLSFEQLQLLLETGRNYKHYLIVRMLIVTGARLSEILGLHWNDIDFETGKIHIVKTVDSRNRKEKDRTKTKSSKRNIILDKETLEYLRLKKQALKVVFFSKDERLVFVADDGRPMRHRAVELTFKRMLKKVGLEEMGIHCIRHSVLTNLNDGGIPIADILALSGHVNIDSLKDYLHFTKTGLNILDTLSSQTKWQTNK
ncbi:MAG: site-specific integrase [Syntrophomonadaceae bacterium]|nr:site-specific integrase [Syntrophomonadaceae bacterium]